MKKLIVFALVCAFIITGTAWALESEEGIKLTGAHYNLNIIGVKKAKTADMDSDHGTGGVIFVALSGKSKIGLVESGSPAYEVGLRSGDRLVAVDGRPIDSPDTYQLALNVP